MGLGNEKDNGLRSAVVFSPVVVFLPEKNGLFPEKSRFLPAVADILPENIELPPTIVFSPERFPKVNLLPEGNRSFFAGDLVVVLSLLSVTFLPSDDENKNGFSALPNMDEPFPNCFWKLIVPFFMLSKRVIFEVNLCETFSFVMARGSIYVLRNCYLQL